MIKFAAFASAITTLAYSASALAETSGAVEEVIRGVITLIGLILS